ncbi:hypothetical protein ACJX0J_020924 [Zea mays]
MRFDTDIYYKIAVNILDKMVLEQIQLQNCLEFRILYHYENTKSEKKYPKDPQVGDLENDKKVNIYLEDDIKKAINILDSIDVNRAFYNKIEKMSYIHKFVNKIVLHTKENEWGFSLLITQENLTIKAAFKLIPQIYGVAHKLTSLGTTPKN